MRIFKFNKKGAIGTIDAESDTIMALNYRYNKCKVLAQNKPKCITVPHRQNIKMISAFIKPMPRPFTDHKTIFKANRKLYIITGKDIWYAKIRLMRENKRTGGIKIERKTI